MRIAELAPLWKTVPPQKYGGVEIVVANLDKGLVGLGHDVTLFACGGSKSPGKFVKVVDKPIYDIVGEFSWKAIQPYEFLIFDELFKRLGNFDIIHNHLGYHPLVFSKLINIPMVTTIHSSLEPDFPYLAQRFKDNLFVSISDAQRKLAPYLNYVKTIHLGIDTEKFKPNIGKSNDYFAFIGSLTKNKGIDLAIKVARELKVKLIIAGEIREEEKDFLQKEVWPYVDNDNIKFIGEVEFRQKVKLLANAKALLFPIRWNEAFGLVMAEALACATPVVAFDKGSVKEIVKNGETGFVVDNFEEFKSKVKDIDKISRTKCRKDAVEKFDLSTMVNNYIKLFEDILKK
ncbi:MAG: glycosyltransferase family 4 protein [Candidatus Curtissbacteria bacterium]